jgi:hypothetical protein
MKIRGFQKWNSEWKSQTLWPFGFGFGFSEGLFFVMNFWATVKNLSFCAKLVSHQWGIFRDLSHNELLSFRNYLVLNV